VIVTETHLNQEMPGNAAEAAPVEAAAKHRYIAPFVALAAWIVPGMGHLLLGRWGRALTFFLVVSGLAVFGFLAKGQVFPPHSDDPFGTLGFLADACSGVFFVLAHFFEKTGPDVSRAAGDYGTRFVAAAGIVNLLSVLDAYRIAAGSKL
jgi:predicted membrane channel-forming protein YqfA (hemolysin III family)